jgi:hypothetical protein
MTPVAALLASVFVCPPAAAAPAAVAVHATGASVPSGEADALSKARQSFVAQQAGQPTLDAVAKLPAASGPEDPALASARLAIDAAKDVQLGCEVPCSSPADVQVYSGKVELIARRLGLKDDQVAAALKNYIPDGKPRLRVAAGAKKNPADQALEAEVVARLLSQEKLAPQIREQLSRKALAMADALGRTGELKADAAGVVTFPDGQRARMTADQLARLNAIPQSQARILRHLATNPPPPPLTAQQRQDKVLAEADREIAAAPGLIGDSYNYWDQEAKDPSSGWAWKSYAKFNKGLLTFSGLKSVEESSERLGYVWDNPDVGKGEKFWLGTKLAGNAALSAVSFLPAASFAKSLQAGEGFYWIGKAGTAVPGAVRAAAPEAAEASRALTTTIAETLPQGAKVGTPELRAMIGALNEKVARYGITVAEGGCVAECGAQGGNIFVSLKVGAQHETVHVVQQVYTRVMALEQMAAETGTTVEALSAAQRAEAFANAAKWETASYAQLESQAYRATGFMGMGGGTQYTKQLLLTGQEVTAGMKNGAVLDGSFGLGARIYGRTTQVLGHSQAQIGTGVAALFAGTENGPMGDGLREQLDIAARPYTAATDDPRPLIAGGTTLDAMTPAPAALLMQPLFRYARGPVPGH